MKGIYTRSVHRRYQNLGQKLYRGEVKFWRQNQKDTIRNGDGARREIRRKFRVVCRSAASAGAQECLWRRTGPQQPTVRRLPQQRDRTSGNIPPLQHNNTTTHLIGINREPSYEAAEEMHRNIATSVQVQVQVHMHAVLIYC